MKSGIHLQKKLRQVITKDGAIVTYKLVHFPKPNQSLATSKGGNEKTSTLSGNSKSTLLRRGQLSVPA